MVDSIFYLKPRGKWLIGDSIWFESRPIGKNVLDQRFKKMCKDAGLKGNFTNHSGRATAITRLYQAGVQEKKIMKRSGHQSVECVRAYQREDPQDNVEVSNILSSSRNVVIGNTSIDVNNDVEGMNEDDELVLNACLDYEKSVSRNVDLNNLLQGASVQNVTINININK